LELSSSCATAVLIDPASGNRIAGADPRPRLLRHGVLNKDQSYN
jgi:hypothetical protein